MQLFIQSLRTNYSSETEAVAVAVTAAPAAAAASPAALLSHEHLEDVLLRHAAESPAPAPAALFNLFQVLTRIILLLLLRVGGYLHH